jgi:NAD+ diphosphatase
MYSVLAGFVEPGETLEEAVVREVKEEVGVDVKEIRYFGSQPWPFPHSLMIGFTAAYEGGEISLDDVEIEEAGWFTVDNLPSIPGKISIARKLIDWFIAKQEKLRLRDK